MINPKQCPGCGNANQCAQANACGQDNGACWCLQMPHLPLSEPLSAQACWCQQCLQLRQTSDDAKPTREAE